MRLPQFKLAGILWALFWLSLSFALWQLDPPERMPHAHHQPLVYFMLDGFAIAAIPTAIGALFGHTLRGFLIGVAIYIGLMALVS